MALSDEQNAMLRLLAQGEQGYGDIAALMGLQESEVRAKVVGALAQLEAEGKPAPDIPPPVSGGARPAAEVNPPEPEPVAEVSEDADADEADEPAVADAVAPPEPIEPSGPAAPRARRKPKAGAASERTGKPAASPTRAPGDRPDRSVAAAGDAPGRRAAGARGPTGAPTSAPTGRTITLPTGPRAWQLGGGIAAGIAVIVVVVLLVSGGGGGGGDSSSITAENQSTNASAGTGAGNEAGGGAKASTQAELTAVDGSDAEGLAAFGRVENKLALQVEATGLEPTEEGTNSYTIWLAQSPKRMLPLASIGVKGSGQGANAIAAQFEVPVEVLAYLATGTFDQIAITKTDNDRFEASVNAATKAKTTPTYTGDAVLRGTITGRIVGIAKREEEQKGE